MFLIGQNNQLFSLLGIKYVLVILNDGKGFAAIDMTTFNNRLTLAVQNDKYSATECAEAMKKAREYGIPETINEALEHTTRVKPPPPNEKKMPVVFQICPLPCSCLKHGHLVYKDKLERWSPPILTLAQGLDHLSWEVVAKQSTTVQGAVAVYMQMVRAELPIDKQ